MCTRADRQGRRATLFALCGLSLWCMASAAAATTIYKCVAPDGRTTFRDTPCAARAHATRLDLAGQPLIDPAAPRVLPRRTEPAPTPTRPARRTRSHRPQLPMSWECRAADGEVFFRHDRCPSSVPGDGTVRGTYADTMAQPHRHRHRNAWSRIRVRGKKIPRTAACKLIHSPAAAVRDGHLRDATVSTYDHLMGRDPCDGA